MRKYFIIFLFLLTPLFVFAQSGEKKNRGFRVTPRNTEELRQVMNLREEGFQKELAGMEGERLFAYSNQNKMRAAAQNMTIMENMIGDGGIDVSDLALEINKSVEKTLDLEERFLKRGGIKKFFFGQKKDEINDFSTEISNREEKISKIRSIYEKCECSEDVRDIFGEELANMENEQNRLKDFFEKETKHKGVLSWFASIFDK
ncbi:hypothetical protein C0584_04200 [Candidatus Parcubacteria bacterium]|nr:MAG: hypothetical protein C0584_04200 [Candidatus Parcubacteria bacterium]